MFRASERPLGWMADYCPICRDLQPHRLFFSRAQQNRAAFHFRECIACELRTEVDPSTYLAIAPSNPDDLVALIEQTYPRIVYAAVNRVMYDRAAIEQKLDHPERIEALREPFQLSGYLVGKILSIDQMIVHALAIGVITSFVPVIFAVPIAQQFTTRTSQVLYSVLVGGGLIGFIFGLYQVRKKHRRIVEQIIVPRLCRALRPLKPTPDELKQIDAWLSFANHPLRRHVQMDALYERIRVEPDRSLTNVDSINMLELAKKMHEELQARYQTQQNEHADQQSDEEDEFPFSPS